MAVYFWMKGGMGRQGSCGKLVQSIVDDCRPSHLSICQRPFIILFFLADDTVQIREQYPLNCGRHARIAAKVVRLPCDPDGLLENRFRAFGPK